MDRDFRELIASIRRNTAELDALNVRFDREMAEHCRAVDDLLQAARDRLGLWPDVKARA